MKKRLIFDLLVISFLGLIPLLWFHENQVLLGHDAGLAFDAVAQFVDRFYVWTQRFGMGMDQSALLLGAFMIHGIEAFLSWIGFSLPWQQKIQFIFWFILPGLTMYFFAYSFWKEKRFLPLFASVIYMLNFYLIQAWFVAERTKFSLYTAVPLIFYFLFRYMTGKLSFFWTIILTGLTFGIFNGGGSFPLYGGLVVGILVFLVYINFINWNFITLRRTVFYILGTCAMYLLLNAYWLVPYVYYLSGSFSSELAAAGGVDGAITWAKYLSGGSTFMNLFRGQGIPEWHLNAYHAYAQSYMSNPILIVASFFFPILAFCSLLVRTKKDSFYIYLFVLFALIGIFFSSGPQSQLGSLFELLMQYVPGFAMFRSAFYKFNYLLWFAYGILIAYTLDFLFTGIQKRFAQKFRIWVSTSLILLFVVAYVSYHFPVLSGSFFDYSHEPGKELTTRITVPDYIFEFGEWVNKQDPSRRFLIMPQLGEQKYISYTWGYWSLAPINSLLSRNSFIHNSAGNSESEQILLQQMYVAFLRNDMESFRDYADVFGIDAIVLQKDLDWQNKSWGTYDPKRYEDILKKEGMFTLEKTFGEWDVYRLADREDPIRMTATNRLTFLHGDLADVVSFPYYSPKAPLFIDKEQPNADYFAKNATEILFTPECIQCDMQIKLPPFQYYNPRILPGSTLYPLIKYKERKAKEQAHTFSSLVTYYVTFSDRKIIEAKWMLDSETNVSHIPETIVRYQELVHELKELLMKSEWDEKATEENKMAQLILFHIKEQVNVMDSLYKKDSLLLDSRQILASVYDDLLVIRDLAKKKLWTTEALQSKKYVLNILQPGEYEMFIKKSSLTDPKGDIGNVRVGFSGDPLKLSPNGQVGDWLSFGMVDLGKEKQRIVLEDSTMRNTISTAEQGFPDTAEGITVVDNNISFLTKSLGKCMYYDVHNLQVVDEYILQFYYRNLSEKQEISFFTQQPEAPLQKYLIKNSYLPNSLSWSKKVLLVAPKAENLRIYFCNGFLSFNEMDTLDAGKELLESSEDETISEIKDIRLEKISSPDIVFYKKQGDEDDALNTPISFTKKDPLTYQANLSQTEGPISIVMRESYGKYWQLCYSETDCVSNDDKSHFASAGFENAWFFKDGTKESFTISYSSQRMFLIGIFVTIGAIIGIIILVCWKKIKRK